MEGRTIVRPGMGGGRARPTRAGTSMEGRTIVRPGGRAAAGHADAPGTSMEGRTIVRPGQDRHRGSTTAANYFNGGAGQLSGQAWVWHGRSMVHANFNGGPDNCPARPHCRVLYRWTQMRLQWRAGQLSGQAQPSRSQARRKLELQWRAGQLSGQAIWCPLPSQRHAPLQWRAGQLSGQAPRRPNPTTNTTGTSMEGRTIVRPGPLGLPARDHAPTTSMEGRTIVRPGKVQYRWTQLRKITLQWRAGQLSGQALSLRTSHSAANSLQWRAGQLSGQAGAAWRGMAHTFLTSMEGRTIVRPGVQRSGRLVQQRNTSMEGRTIVRPGHHNKQERHNE